MNVINNLYHYAFREGNCHTSHTAANDVADAVLFDSPFYRKSKIKRSRATNFGLSVCVCDGENVIRTYEENDDDDDDNGQLHHVI